MSLRRIFVILFGVLLSACRPVPPTQPAVFTVTSVVHPTQSACTTLAVEPTPGPDIPSLIPLESPADRMRGSETPIVTVLIYGDYQDTRSQAVAEATGRLLADYSNDVRVVNRIFPLIDVNDKSALAAQAVEAADAQGKFWEMNDLLYAQHGNWWSLSAQDFEQWVTAQASGLGMDAAKFKSDWKREDIVVRVQAMAKEAQSIGIPGVPLVLINGQIYNGPRDYASLRDIVELIRLGKRQFASCPPLTVQTNKQYIATLRTEKGDVVIQLFADKAPITVNSFLFLAQNGWYDNITFHRVVPELFAQTGDPSGTGKGNPGYYIVTEIDPALKFDKPGMVAMVNSGPDASGGQFFITYASAPQLDGRYTIFGQVLRGMDVLESLSSRDVQPGTDQPPGDRLLRVEIDE